MKRKALIIGATADDIPGVVADVANYKNFLMSAAGGAWTESEINVLWSPGPLRLAVAQVELKLADYSMCIFGGHGGYNTSTGKTIIELNANDRIDVQELNAGASRHTVIVDSCRTHFTPVLEEAMRKAEAGLEKFADKGYARRVYDAHIAKCAPTIAKMYSCSDGEGAGDSSKGGLFSYSLLRSARNWSEQRTIGTNVLEVNQAFALAEATVKNQTGGRQNPDGLFVRTGPKFPFAISTDRTIY